MNHSTIIPKKTSRSQNFGPSVILASALLLFLTGHPAYHTLTQNVTTGRYYLSYQKTCDLNEPAQLLEFSPAGQLTRSLLIPNASQGGFQPVSDVIALSDGSMALLHGFPKTSLHVYSPQSHSWKSHVLDGVVLNNTSFGALTTDGRYAYFPASAVTARGIVRLDPNTGAIEHSPLQQTYHDLQWNKDGKLYALSETKGQEVHIDILDAKSLIIVDQRHLTLPTQSTVQSLAVNQRGEIYLLGENNQMFLFAPSAQLLKVATLAANESTNKNSAESLFSDLDLDSSGMVFISDNANRRIIAVNQDLTSVRTISRLEQTVNSEISGDRCSNAYLTPLPIES